MTRINPVQSFREMPKAKKVATVAAGVGIAAATVAGIAYGVRKGKADGTKATTAIANGLKGLGEKAKGKLVAVKDTVVSKFAKKGAKVQETVQEVAQEVAEAVAE